MAVAAQVAPGVFVESGLDRTSSSGQVEAWVQVCSSLCWPFETDATGQAGYLVPEPELGSFDLDLVGSGLLGQPGFEPHCFAEPASVIALLQAEFHASDLAPFVQGPLASIEMECWRLYYLGHPELL